MALSTRAIDSMPGAAIATRAIEASPDPEQLTAKEREIYRQHTTDRRRSEWWSGRICARAALEQLGARELSVLAHARGLPKLDGEGAERFFISISHGRRVAAAAAAREDARYPCLGIDVVDPEDADRIAKISRRFLTAHELRLIEDDPQAAMLAWGAREAIAKATSTGMFAFALKSGAIRAIDRRRRRVEVELEGIEATFEPIPGDGLVVLAATTRAISEAAQRGAGLLPSG